jgi:hypothetical protein
MFSFKLMRFWLVLLLLTVCWHTAVTVGAQGLVGAPVDPRYGQGFHEAWRYWRTHGYDGARDMVRIATGVSVLLACLFWLVQVEKGFGKAPCERACLARVGSAGDLFRWSLFHQIMLAD